MSVESLIFEMKQLKITAVDIAAGTKLDPSTVKRFIKTGRCHPSTLSTIERYIEDVKRTRQAAAG